MRCSVREIVGENCITLEDGEAVYQQVRLALVAGEAVEWEFEGTKDKLIIHIEENGLETELRNMVGRCWNGIEDSFRFTGRKRRFD